MRLDKALYTVFDVETTGLYPFSGDRICEIGATKIGPGGVIVDRFHSLVDPRRPLSERAFAVNGITPEMLEGQPTVTEILPRFLDFAEGTTLVAYNARFDLGFVRAELGQDRERIDRCHTIDALMLARRLFPALGRYSLPHVAGSLGIAVGRCHRAMDDVMMTVGIFKKEIDALEACGVKEIEDISWFQSHASIPNRNADEEKRRVIAEAILRGKRLHITYHSVWTNTITRRIVTPKKLQQGFERAYLIAHCHLRNEERNFILEGIIDVTPAVSRRPRHEPRPRTTRPLAFYS